MGNERGAGRGICHGHGLCVEGRLWRIVGEPLGGLRVQPWIAWGIVEGVMWRRRKAGGLGIVGEVQIRVVVARDVEDVLQRHETRGREGGPGLRYRRMLQLPDGEGSMAVILVVAAGVTARMATS